MHHQHLAPVLAVLLLTAPARDDVTLQLLFLGLVLVVINVAWQAPLAWAAVGVRRWLSRPRMQLTVNMGTRTILIVFALLMLWEHVIAHP